MKLLKYLTISLVAALLTIHTVYDIIVAYRNRKRKKDTTY